MAAEPSSQTEGFTSNTTRAMVATALLAITILVEAAAIASESVQIGLVYQIVDGEAPAAAIAASDARQQFLAFAQIALLVITAVAYCFWLYRAYQNLRSLGSYEPASTPGRAVAAFFIPIVSLFQPYQVHSEIWKASDPQAPAGVRWQQAPNSPLIATWWLTYLGSRVISTFGLRASAGEPTVAQILGRSQLIIFVSVLEIIAAVLAIMMVMRIERRQVEKSERLEAAGHNAAEPSP